MMQDLRQKTKWIMLVVAVAFVGLMVFEWGMDISGQSTGAQTGELGRVNGEPVPYAAYMQLYQQLYDRAREQTGGTLSREQIRQVEEMAWNQVVGELLIQQQLEERGIRVTDEEIRQAARFSPHPDLMQQEIFQTDGRFDLSKYQQFLASPSANEEILLQLEQYYREVIPRAKLMRQVAAGAYASDADLWRAWRDQTETATVEYVPLEISKLVPGDVEVTEAEIRDYYETHADDFERAATARFAIAYLPKAATPADSAAALQRAEAIRAELVGGADFAEVARRESADPGSREQGGELGTFRRGQMAPAFDEAVFSAPIGEITEPVATPFGYHLIQVRERNDEEATARHILIPIEKSTEAEDQIYARADSLEALAERAGLARAARATEAQLRQSVTVTEEDAFVPGIGSVLEAIEWALDEWQAEPDTAAVSPLFETPQAFYLVRPEGVAPAGRIPLAEATPRIRRELIVEKKRAQAREVGQQIVQQVRAGQPLAQVAAQRGLTVETAGPFTRVGFNPAFGQANAATGAAFGVPIRQVSDVVETPAGLFIIRPTARTEADRAAFEAQKQQQRAGLTARLQQEQVARWLEDLRKEAEIVDQRNEVLRRTA